VSRRDPPRAPDLTRIPTSAGRGVRAVLGLDVLLSVAALVWTFVDPPATPAWALWATRALLLLSAAASGGSAALSGNAIVWRRRLGVLAVVLALWRDGPVPFALGQAAVVVWTGLVWIALLLAAREIQRAIVEATGEEGLPDV
jgi:hypothetical protein